MKLIDKSALVAEIKTRIETYNKGYANGDDCRADALETFLHDIDTLEVKIEPESEDLEEAAMQYAKSKHKDTTLQQIVSWDFKAGAQWQKENLWKNAQGDDLPEIDREVIVLYQHYPLDVGEYSVGFAHRPPEYWDGKNIGTGVVTRYYPKKYGKGGWSSPDVKWWLDLDLPKPKVEK